MRGNQVSTTYVAIIAGMGMLLSTLDSGIISIAMPYFVQIFHVKLNVIVWIVTLYTLTLSTTILLFGKLADRYGRLKIYMIGLALFSLSSLFCGLSNNIQFLILFRTLQGLSAAMIQATAIAVITTKLEKPEAIKAIGILGMLMGVGAALGPLLGGLMLSTIGWRWIFWFNIPICLITLLSCQKLKLTSKEILQDQTFNYFSLFLFGLSMTLLLLSMNYMTENIKFSSWLLVVMLLIFMGHFKIELKSKYRIIDYQLFKNIRFTASIISAFVTSATTAIVFILPPIFLAKLRYFDAWHVGLISFSTPLGMVIASRIFIPLSKKFSIETLMISGLGIITLSLMVLTMMNIHWSILFIILLLFVYGLGSGIFISSNIMHLTSQFPTNKQAFISSLLRMIQNAAIAFGVAASVLLINLKSSENLSLLIGIQHGWQLASILSLFALASLIYMYTQKKAS